MKTKKKNLKKLLENKNNFLKKNSFLIILLNVILLTVSFIHLSMRAKVLSLVITAKIEEIQYSLTLIIGFALFRILRYFLIYLKTIKEQQFEEQILTKTKNLLIKHIKNLSSRQLNKLSSGYLTNLFLQDASYAAAYFLTKIQKQELYLSLLFNLFFLAVEFYKGMDTKSNLLIILSIVILINLIFFTFFFSIRKLQKTAVEDEIQLNNFLTDRISGLKTTQIFNQQQKQQQRFAKINNSLKIKSQKLHLLRNLLRRIFELLFVGVNAYLAWYFFKGKTLDNDFEFQKCFNSFDNFLHVIFDLLIIFPAIYNKNINLNNNKKYLNKINEILATETEIINLNNNKKITKIIGKVEFKNVWFAYNEENWILKDVSFVILPKQTVAFVGTTGSGKTTIINLILKNYNIQKGQILIDNVDIKEMDAVFLREQINQMIQDIFLFEGTIKDNITLKNNNISLQEIMKISKVIGLDKIVNKFPNKYHFPVSSQGSNFSLGEKQLISFARILVRKRNLVILDEATSSVDSETENILQQAIQKLMKQNTLIVIAHRLSTIKDSDKIIVLNKGKIIEEGNHQLLMNKRQFYFNLVNANNKQFSYEK